MHHSQRFMNTLQGLWHITCTMHNHWWGTTLLTLMEPSQTLKAASDWLALNSELCWSTSRAELPTCGGAHAELHLVSLVKCSRWTWSHCWGFGSIYRPVGGAQIVCGSTDNLNLKTQLLKWPVANHRTSFVSNRLLFCFSQCLALAQVH